MATKNKTKPTPTAGERILRSAKNARTAAKSSTKTSTTPLVVKPTLPNERVTVSVEIKPSTPSTAKTQLRTSTGRFARGQTPAILHIDELSVLPSTKKQLRSTCGRFAKDTSTQATTLATSAFSTAMQKACDEEQRNKPEPIIVGKGIGHGADTIGDGLDLPFPGTCVEPREMLRTAIAVNNVTVTQLAKAIGYSRDALNVILLHNGRISVDMAFRLGVTFKMVPTYWIGLQASYDLWKLRTTRGSTLISKIKVLAT